MLYITQSGIKSIFRWNPDDEMYERRDTVCPRKWKAIFMDNIKTPSTQAQAYGVYFEGIIGANREASIRELPRLKNGKASVIEERLHRQAEAFRGIRMKYGFSMDYVQVILKKEYLKDRVMLKGTFDIFDITGKVPYNVDIKVCGNAESDFGEFQWKEPEKKDYLQAKFYDYLFYGKYNVHCKHIFLVFDYSPRMNIKEVVYEVTMDDHKQVEWLVEQTLDLIVQWHKLKYPANPSVENCRNCPFGYREMNKFEKTLHHPLTHFGDGSCEYKITKFKEEP